MNSIVNFRVKSMPARASRTVTIPVRINLRESNDGELYLELCCGSYWHRIEIPDSPRVLFDGSVSMEEILFEG